MSVLILCLDTLIQSMQCSCAALIAQFDDQLASSVLENAITADERDRRRRSAAPSPEPCPLAAERATMPNTISASALARYNTPES